MFGIASRNWVRSKVFLAGAGSTAILLGAGGTALAVTAAATPVSHGLVRACYASTSGALRVVTSRAPRCERGEKAISWPQTPSSVNGYATTFGFNQFTKKLTGTLEPIAVLNLPAGASYIVSASQNVLDAGPAALDWAKCELLDGPKTAIGVAVTTIPFDSSADGWATLSSTAYSPHGGTITMECNDQHAEATVFNWELTATQVTHLTLGSATVGAGPRGSSVELRSGG
jgi:hypothetical protein